MFMLLLVLLVVVVLLLLLVCILLFFLFPFLWRGSEEAVVACWRCLHLSKWK
jgi:hypothetical protein